MDRADLEQWKGREVARLLALVETERRYYQEIAASFPIGALIVSRNLTIVFANRAFRRLAGIRPGELQSKTLDQVIASPRLAASIEETLRTSTAQSNIPVDVGGYTFQASVIPLEGWEDDPESEALIALEGAGPVAAAQTSGRGDWPALLWSMDPLTQHFLSVDGAAEHLLGYSALHWTSTPGFWQHRIHSADRPAVLDFYRTAIRKGGEFGCEYRALTASGKTVWRRDAFRVTLDPDGAAVGIKGITTGIDARRRAEQDNLQANRVEALTVLSRRLAHDLNNTLMVVTGYAEELLGHMAEGDSRRSDVRSILAAAESMAGLTGELHGFTRKQAAPPLATDLSAVLASVSARIRQELAATLVLRLPQHRLSAYADPVQLDAVLLAVARRLRDKSDPHMILAAGEIWIDEMSNLPHAPKPGRYVEISVRGPFLSEVPAASFEAFLSGKDPHGSDMARAFAIVREWGGTLFSHRTEHTSEVHLILPAVVEQPVAVPGPAVEKPATVVPPPPAVNTVLVVEDEKGIRGLIQKILKREGYEVLVASNGDEAEQVADASASPIRLLVTDLNLGGKTGRAVADRLTEKHPDLRVLYISGYTDDPEVTVRELGPGAPFLQKPFTLAALTKKVREIVEPAGKAMAAGGSR